MRLGIVPEQITLNLLPPQSPSIDLNSDGSCSVAYGGRLPSRGNVLAPPPHVDRDRVAAAREDPMNSIQRVLIGVAAVVLMLPAAAAAQKVSYDIGTADFGGLRTFAFRNGPATDGDTEKTTGYDSPLVRERTEVAISEQLQARGLERDDRRPDMYVTARRAFKTEYSVYAYPDWGVGYGWGYGWGPYYTGWSPYGSTWYTDERVVGTLIVDVQNAATGQLIWRGLAEKHVHEHASPAHRTKRVNKEVTKMFEKFPQPR
jgi:hypothetical protein